MSIKNSPSPFPAMRNVGSLYAVRYVVTQTGTRQSGVSGASSRRSNGSGRCWCGGAFSPACRRRRRACTRWSKSSIDEGARFSPQHRRSRCYYPVAKALRHMSGELEKLRGFVRFSDYSGVLGAEIEPKNRVLPAAAAATSATAMPMSPSSSTTAPTSELLVYTKGHSRSLAVD